MKRVPRKQVVNAWLRLEQEKQSDKEFHIDSTVEESKNIAQLLAHKPDAASIFWKYDFDWFYHEITARELRTLHTIWEGNTIFDVARAIEEDRSSLSETRIEKIKSIASKDTIEELGPLIIYRWKGLQTGPFLADGNHRAVALALRTFAKEDYTTQSVYVGYPANAYSKLARGYFHEFLDRL